MNPQTGEIRALAHKETVPDGWIELPYAPHQNCKRCFGRGHVGKVKERYLPCPKCYSKKNRALFSFDRALERAAREGETERAAATIDRPEGESA